MKRIKFLIRSNYIEYILVSTILLTATLNIIPHYCDCKLFGDQKNYVKLSENITSNEVKSPFKKRILTPLIVSVVRKIIPLDIRDTFLIINFLAIFSTSLLIYFYLKDLKFSKINSLVGSLMFLSFWVVNKLSGFPLVDPLSYLFFTICFFALLKNKDYLFSISLFIGVLNKEIILILIPLYLINSRNVLRTIKISTPAIVGFLLLSYFQGGFGGYTSGLFHSEPLLILIRIFLAFGFSWIYIIFLPNVKREFIRKNKIYFLFVFLISFLAIDFHRVLFYMFPLFLPLICEILETYIEKSNIKS